ncbi:DegV family protein [Oceanirhabdus sp. W0125-5]|uniref:DegV family protein n=1 Tax=Oceanirhabdus sp. W0125-5 TaxID=2999116 RepID=UPI0022F2B3AC|nr:DegV family protein [Oceanirhabdus sp. W0125-5]WBW95158.1 DegV family protein [Oceanirhabdus sp. W0125-5]
MIKIIVDSTCDLPIKFLEENNIDVLPLRVLIKDEEYFDKQNIKIEKVFEYMKEGIVPRTSLPRLDVIREVFTKKCAEGEDFIYLSLSSKLSGTFQAAKLIMEELREDYPEINMEVIDTKAASIGIGLMVMELIEMINDGASFCKLIDSIEFYKDNCSQYFTLTDLHWLTKGGRLPKSKAIIGTVMNIKPVLAIMDGAIEVVKSLRGSKKSLKYIVDNVIDEMDVRDCEYIGIAHADDINSAEFIKSRINDMYPNRKIIITTIGSVLASHIGIGGLGVFTLSKYKE